MNDSHLDKYLDEVYYMLYKYFPYNVYISYEDRRLYIVTNQYLQINALFEIYSTLAVRDDDYKYLSIFYDGLEIRHVTKEQYELLQGYMHIICHKSNASVKLVSPQDFSCISYGRYNEEALQGIFKKLNTWYKYENILPYLKSVTPFDSVHTLSLSKTNLLLTNNVRSKVCDNKLFEYINSIDNHFIVVNYRGWRKFEQFTSHNYVRISPEINVMQMLSDINLKIKFLQNHSNRNKNITIILYDLNHEHCSYLAKELRETVLIVSENIRDVNIMRNNYESKSFLLLTYKEKGYLYNMICK